MSHQEHIEAVATTATKITIGGTGGAVFFGLTETEVGVMCAIGSFLVTVIAAGFKIYFDWQAHKLKIGKPNES